MMNWWRAYHGLPYDPRLATIAKRSSARRGDVVAIWLALHDHASQNEDRGSIADIDPEDIAVAFDCEVEVVRGIMLALEEKGMTEGGRIAAWEREQVFREREDDSKRAGLRVSSA